MTFKRLSEYFSQLEETSLRLKMTEILSSLFKEAENNEIGKLCYLLQGRVAPLYEAIEFGVADKMMIKAIAAGLKVDVENVVKEFKKEGDLGIAVEKIKNPCLAGRWEKSKIKNTDKKLKIIDVYNTLYKVATSGGEGSQEEKMKLLGRLLHEVDPLSARYIVRITLCKLRLGFSDMTILDSLSWMIKGTKELRPEIEKAYNVRPDLGFISKTIKEKGIEGLKHVTPKIGTPILMARAERMASGADIVEKIGKCAIEPKYDGLRLQGHLSRIRNRKGKFIKFFSRNLEDVTHMYPDVVKGVKEQVKAREAIFEGEAIAYNPKTNEYLPFQETVQRKRKYAIEEMAKKVPLRLIVFDLLYVDGESLLNRPFLERRKRLEKILN